MLDALESQARPLPGSEAADQRDQFVGHTHQRVGQLAELRQRPLLVDQRDQRRRREHVVHDVIELFGEGVDVLPVIGGDEAGI